MFCDAIIDTIKEHNEQIRLKAVDNCFKLIAKDIEVCKCNDESDNDSEDENENESSNKEAQTSL